MLEPGPSIVLLALVSRIGDTLALLKLSTDFLKRLSYSSVLFARDSGLNLLITPN
jgi:hypothetical protein